MKETTSTKKNNHSVTSNGVQKNPLHVRSVARIQTPEELLLHGMRAFSAAYVRRIYQILDYAIGRGVPLVVSVSGPVTVSNQHRIWLNDLIDAGWVAYLTTTGAVCYHDGHYSIKRGQMPMYETAIDGKDREYRKAGVIRVANVGFDEGVLYDQDDFFTSLFCLPEMQHEMTGTEYRNILGKYLAAQEQRFGVEPGLMATCYRNAVPVFVGAPGDASDMLNHVKLHALTRRGIIMNNFKLDVAAEVFESCAYHYHCLTTGLKELGILILGGGVPKNFSLQPEPALSQIFQLAEIGGYNYDVQIVSVPVIYGCLTSCKPDEAHTWGKVTGEALGVTTESLQADYSIIMPMIAWALLDKRERFRKMRNRLGSKKLYARHPEARGYLREGGGLRLYDKREALVEKLLDRITRKSTLRKLKKSWAYPLPNLVG